MSSSLIVSVGELLWDRLPDGARLGGATANFAIGCARLGHAAALITCLGKDPDGERAIQVLEEQVKGFEFDMSGIAKGDSLPTGLVDVVLSPCGHPAYTIASPVAWDEICLTTHSLQLAAEATAICFGSLAQRSHVSRKTIRRLVEGTPAECVRIFDANVRPPFCSVEVIQWSVKQATLVKVSDEELALVLSYLGIEAGDLNADSPFEQLLQAGRKVLACATQADLVALTLGARGSLLISHDAEDYHPGFPTSVVDTVGSGDAFTAGLAHAFLHGASLQAMNTVGNLCGSFASGQRGATPLFPELLIQRISSTISAE